MPDTAETEIVDEVERRQNLRRSDDVKRYSVLLGLVGLIFAAGVAWGTASLALQGKANRADLTEARNAFTQHVVVDSLNNLLRDATLMSIKATTESTNVRLRRFICAPPAPSYCQ